MKQVKKALGRIYAIVSPWLLCFHKLNAIYDWDNKLVTACLASVSFFFFQIISDKKKNDSSFYSFTLLFGIMIFY